MYMHSQSINQQQQQTSIWLAETILEALFPWRPSTLAQFFRVSSGTGAAFSSAMQRTRSVFKRNLEEHIIKDIQDWRSLNPGNSLNQRTLLKIVGLGSQE